MHSQLRRMHAKKGSPLCRVEVLEEARALRHDPVAIIPPALRKREREDWQVGQQLERSPARVPAPIRARPLTRAPATPARPHPRVGLPVHVGLEVPPGVVPLELVKLLNVPGARKWMAGRDAWGLLQCEARQAAARRGVKRRPESGSRLTPCSTTPPPTSAGCWSSCSRRSRSRSSRAPRRTPRSARARRARPARGAGGGAGEESEAEARRRTGEAVEKRGARVGGAWVSGACVVVHAVVRLSADSR